MRTTPRDHLAAVLGTISADGPRRVAFESRWLPHAEWRRLGETAPDVTWVAALDLVERWRARKDADEIAALTEAVALADDAYADLLTWIAPGMREFEVAARCEYFQFLRGGGRRGSETAVGSGPRSAMPHCIASDRILRADEAVLLDLGCSVRGYMSDLTRTVFLGRVPDEFAAIHRVVGEAQARVIEQLRPGVTGREMQAVAADHIAAAGYGDAFPHGLGHSIGLMVHERPGFAASSADRIEAGNVITVEPGIYLAGRFGVRTEDIVLVTDTGCRTLTAADHALAVR